MVSLPADIARCTGVIDGAACPRRADCARWLAGTACHDGDEIAVWTAPSSLWPACDLHMEVRHD